MNTAPSKALSIIDHYATSRQMERAALEETMFRNIMQPNSTKADLVVFLQLASRHNLDPFAGEIICIMPGGKIQPYITYKGYVAIANRHPQYDGFSFTYDQDDVGHISAVTCTIYRKDRAHPAVITEFYDECVAEASPGRKPGPWQKLPSRMLRHKAFMQCVQIAFGITSLEEEDAEGMDIFPTQEKSIDHVTDNTDRPTPPKRTPPPAPSNGKPKTVERVETKTVAHDPETGEIFDGEAFLTELDEMLASAKDKDELQTIWADFEVQANLVADRPRLVRAHDLLNYHDGRITKGLKT